MNEWVARRVTKPWVWYAIMAAALLSQAGLAAATAAFPELREYTLGPQFLLPAVIVAVLGYWLWRAVAPPEVTLRREGHWLVVEDGRRTQRLDLARAQLGYARWEYPNAGTMGTIVEFRAPERRLRFAIKQLLPSEQYTLADSYHYDIHFEQEATAQRVLDAVRAVAGPPMFSAATAPATYAIPLRPNGERVLVPIVVGSFGMPAVLGLIIVPLSTGVTVGTLLLTALGVALAAALVGFILWRRHEGKRYQLRLAPGPGGATQVILDDRHRRQVVAQAPAARVGAVPAYYVMTMRHGTWNIPSIRLTLPGHPDELTIGANGVQDAGWMARATKGKTPRYVVGAAEWQHLVSALTP